MIFLAEVFDDLFYFSLRDFLLITNQIVFTHFLQPIFRHFKKSICNFDKICYCIS